MPFLVLLVAYAVDFGYFFIAASTITSSARNAVLYSVQGYQAPTQGSLPSAGSITASGSVAQEAVADMASLNTSATTTSVQVCTASLGILVNLTNCANYGPAAQTYTPNQDPEAPLFVLHRVDVTYTVQPPIPMSIFKISLLPTMQFHRQVSMRGLN